MNIPNLLTIVRFFLIPLFLIFFFSNVEYSLLYATLIFIVAGFTDFLDGYIARKFNLITKWGQVMDPLADKLMQLCVLISLTLKNYINLYLIIIYGFKEIIMIIGSIYLYSKKEKIIIPANFYGKIATILFYVAVISVCIKFSYSTYVFNIAIITTILALIQYLYIAKKQLTNSNEILENAS